MLPPFSCLYPAGPPRWQPLPAGPAGGGGGGAGVTVWPATAGTNRAGGTLEELAGRLRARHLAVVAELADAAMRRLRREARPGRGAGG